MESEGSVKIWGAGTTRTLRPIWVAHELGLKVDLVPFGPRTGETQTPDYTELNPKQKIPYLNDGEVRMSESVAMCRYLIERYGAQDTMMLPPSIAQRAKEDEWVCYIYGELDETSLYVMRRHRDLAAIYGEAPHAVEASRVYALKHFAVVAAQLEGRSFVVGERFSLADVMLISCIDWAIAYELEIAPSLVEYRNEIAQRQAYKDACALNYANPPA